MLLHSSAALFWLVLAPRPSLASALGIMPVATFAAENILSTTSILDAVGLFIALLSIASKEILFHVTHRVGIRCQSSTLIANAFHHRSDAMSSIASAIGTCGTLIGFRELDLLAALVVGCMVIRMGVEALEAPTH